MARSAFNHSCNYRSVMVMGKTYVVTDVQEKEQRLKTFTDKLFPGRWDILRPVTPRELKATMMLGLSLDEASAKVRTGPPGDDEGDYALPIWAGVIPLRMEVLRPLSDERNLAGMVAPQYVKSFKIG
jgi:uncharacterized protein